jgi:hypothetical protein
MTTVTEASEDHGIYGNVPAATKDRVFNGFLNVVNEVFAHMTPQEIADQIEMQTDEHGNDDENVVRDTFAAIVNLPLFAEWAKGAGRQTLLDAINEK